MTARCSKPDVFKLMLQPRLQGQSEALVTLETITLLNALKTMLHLIGFTFVFEQQIGRASQGNFFLVRKTNDMLVAIFSDHQDLCR